jgi:Domain of unknown function (DUF5916)
LHEKWLLPVFILALSANGFAQDGATTRPHVTALRLEKDETISIDGRLNESVWQRAMPASDFVQQEPANGAAATERTEVRFVFSRTSLYMGVTCFDSEPHKLLGNTMQRDSVLTSGDRFMWSFDPYLDGRSGYYFEMNPSGAMGDSLISAADSTGGTPDAAARAWDGIWFAKVNRSEIGWTLEIEIPFRTLKFNPDAPAWGVNFQRTIRRKNEETLWTGFARNQGVRMMQNAGMLEGISDVSQGIGLDVQPYLTGSYLDARGRNRGDVYKGDVGGDLTYSITPELKLNFTVNTDFAETEVDQRQVNLTRFPLLYPEKRGFFLEGINFFDFSGEQSFRVQPFFSRRIGLDADGQPQRIEYGTKLTGQIGHNDVGFLQVRTASASNLPGDDFSVLRAKHRFFRQSFVGMFYTRRAERNTSIPDRYTFGADFLLATSRFRGSQKLNVNGYYVRTTPTGPSKQTALFGGRVEYPNDRWLARIIARELQPGYDPAVGYFERRNIRFYNPELQFAPRPRRVNRVVRRFVFTADPEFTTDLENRILTRELKFTVFQMDLQSGDSVQVTLTPTREYLERDFEIYKGVKLQGNTGYDFNRYNFRVSTSNQRVLSIDSMFDGGTFYTGRGRKIIANVGIRPRRGVLVNVNNEWDRIELAEGKFSTSVLRLNANTQFSPWISLANNLQYDSVSRILGWQFRYRWILRPGNDIYFVYAHNWLDSPMGPRTTLDRKAATKILYTHRF